MNENVNKRAANERCGKLFKESILIVVMLGRGTIVVNKVCIPAEHKLAM